MGEGCGHPWGSVQRGGSRSILAYAKPNSVMKPLEWLAAVRRGNGKCRSGGGEVSGLRKKRLLVGWGRKLRIGDRSGCGETKRLF